MRPVPQSGRAGPRAPGRPALRRSNRLALLLGGTAIALTCLVGVLAFARGRETMLRGFVSASMVEARTRAGMLQLPGLDPTDPLTLAALEQGFRAQGARFPDTTLVVYDALGVVRLHSGHAERLGKNVRDSAIKAEGADAPRSLGELLDRQRDWAGMFEAFDGSKHVMAIARIPATGGLLGIFVPRHHVLAEIDRVTIPWLLGLALIALLLMPLALFLLHQGYATSVEHEAEAQRDLRESQARLNAAIHDLPCELWIHDREGRILLQNPLAVRNFGRREGKGLDELDLPPEAQRFWTANCARAMAGETFEVDYERGSGAEQRQFHAIVGPVRNEHEILGVCVIKLDVTERKRTEEALSQASRMVDLQFESSPLALIEWDPEMRVRRWSKGAERIFGWSASEVVGRHHAEWSLVHPADLARVAEVSGRLRAGERANTSCNRNLTRDGRTIHCEWHNAVVLGAQGYVTSVLSICQDVTERKQSEAFERLYRDVLRAMLEERPIATVLRALILGMEESLSGARASIQLHDPSSHTLRNAASPSLPSEFTQTVDGLPVGPGDESGVCGRAAFLRQRVVVSDTLADPSTRRFRTLAERFELRAVVSQPILAADGHALGTFAVYFDQPHDPPPGELRLYEEAADLARVTIEHSRSAEEQRQMTARLSLLHDIGREILQSTSIEVVLQAAVDRLSSSGGGTCASIALVEGTPRAASVPMRLVAQGCSGESAAPREVGSLVESFAGSELELLLRGEVLRIDDGRGARGGHPEFHAGCGAGPRAVVVLPMLNHGALVGTLTLCSDAPARLSPESIEVAREAAFLLGVAVVQQRLNEAIRQQAFELERRVLDRTAKLTEVHAEMETYVHTVTHDLRAPLRAIQGFGQALLEDHARELGSEARQYLGRMVTAAERMDSMMRELLAYSRLGRADLHLQGVDLGLIEREAENLIASELEQRATSVEVEGPLGLARGHTPTLVQVLANLLSNAAKFVPEARKPRIRLASERRGGRLRLWVEDNGIGIPPEHQERIWGVFERLHGVDSFPGTGLGLAIVRRAMQRMGGSSGVESVPGEGSRFWIELDADAG